LQFEKSVRKLIFGERQVESNICDSHTTWPLILRKFQFRWGFKTDTVSYYCI